MKRSKKYLKIVGAVVTMIMVSTLISGCSLRGKTSSTPKTFVIWGFDDEDVWKPIIKDAGKDSLKGYEVKYVKKTLNDSYENDALNSILSGQGPDVWAIPNDWVYRHKDKLAPMPDSLVKSSKINLDDQFVPAIKQSGYFDGKIYSLSPVTDTLMVYYNEKLLQSVLEEYIINHGSQNYTEQERVTSLLAQPPTTWSNFVEAVKIITKRNGSTFERSGVALGTSNNIGVSQDILFALMLQNKTKMTSDDLKTATFNLPENNTYPAKNALDFYTSFANPGSPNYTWNAQQSNDLDAFSQGRVAMIFGYESLANKLAQLYPNLSFKKSPLPQIATNNEDTVDYAQYTTFVVPKYSSNSQSAWSFVNFLSGVQVSPQYAATVRITSSSKEANFKPSLVGREFNNDPGVFQTQTATLWVKGRYPKDNDNIFRSTIENVTSGKQDTQSALDSAASTITSLLRKETW